MDFAAWMATVQARTETALGRFLPAAATAPGRLHDGMRYAALGGGKRVRPLLCHAAGEVLGAEAERLDVAACAVEMIHAYSLVHDDLPCMDDDVLRRGKPTCHVEFDEATALLVGDALQTLAFQVLAEQAVADPARQLAMLSLLARASGSRGMAGGQAIDLASIGHPLDEAALRDMHRRKTGALLQASVLMGAATGHADDRALNALSDYGAALGLAFQIVDDILDLTQATDKLGKTAGKDLDANKPTYVTVLGMHEARRQAEVLRDQALAALARSGLDDGARLAWLADLVVERES